MNTIEQLTAVAELLRSVAHGCVYRSEGRAGKWACTVRGQTTYHFRKAEAEGHALRALKAGFIRAQASEVQS